MIGLADRGEGFEADVAVDKRRIVCYLSPLEKGYDLALTYLAMDADRWTNIHTARPS